MCVGWARVELADIPLTPCELPMFTHQQLIYAYDNSNHESGRCCTPVLTTHCTL